MDCIKVLQLVPSYQTVKINTVAVMAPPENVIIIKRSVTLIILNDLLFTVLAMFSLVS